MLKDRLRVVFGAFRKEILGESGTGSLLVVFLSEDDYKVNHSLQFTAAFVGC